MKTLDFHFDFRRSHHGWTAGPNVNSLAVTPSGLKMVATKSDPYIISPLLDTSNKPVLRLDIRLKSNGDVSGNIYYGKEFSEAQSVAFLVEPGGDWQDISIYITKTTDYMRLRVDPCGGPGTVTIRHIIVTCLDSVPPDIWALPKELRHKKLIAAGQYLTSDRSTAVTAKFLAEHPDFITTFPYDGMVLPAHVSKEFCQKQGLGQMSFLHTVVWNKVPLTYDALRESINDLKKIQWKHLTDNFLNYSMIDGPEQARYTPDYANDRDWSIVEQNVALAARLCREVGFKGFWLDTEQYSNYQTQPSDPKDSGGIPLEVKFPLGKDSVATLRKRGQQWIRAAQRELPKIKIMVTFAWSPDTAIYGPLKGSDPFLDGVLDAIKAPGCVINAHENTFYFGQGPGTTHSSTGFPGGRNRYRLAKHNQRDWKVFSQSKSQFDKYFRHGMAAWIEDDPWNTWAGYPSGTSTSLWSNVPLALAYSDEYVWVWNEHTNYRAGYEAGTGTNPFLLSIVNQTHNQGGEQKQTFASKMTRNPLLDGWAFDFDMLQIATKQRENHDVATMDPRAVPYQWDKTVKALRVQSCWPRRPQQPAILATPSQRMRFYRSVTPRPASGVTTLTFDVMLQTEQVRSPSGIYLGMFHSETTIRSACCAVRVHSPQDIRLVVASQKEQKVVPLRLKQPIPSNRKIRITMRLDAKQLGVVCYIVDAINPKVQFASQAVHVPDGLLQGRFDEVGCALPDGQLVWAENPLVLLLLACSFT